MVVEDMWSGTGKELLKINKKKNKIKKRKYFPLPYSLEDGIGMGPNLNLLQTSNKKFFPQKMRHQNLEFNQYQLN